MPLIVNKLVDNIPPELAQAATITNNIVKAGQVVTDSDTGILLEKFANAKVSQVGTIVLDYVEFYLENINIPSKGASNLKNRVSDELRNLSSGFRKPFGTEITDTNELESAFPRGSTFYGVRLDHVYVNYNENIKTATTDILGENGQIIEVLGNGTIGLTFTGLLAGINKYQQDTIKLRQLKALFRQKKAISLNAIHLNSTYNINKIMVDDWNFVENEEYGNLTEFTINARVLEERPFITVSEEL